MLGCLFLNGWLGCGCNATRMAAFGTGVGTA